jgi:ADP-ribose pyrophosphatase YjhB (NUDIX family)
MSGETKLDSGKYRELGIPRARACGFCTHHNNLFVIFSSEQPEIEREYALPGASIRWGERARDTLRRDFKERFNMDVSVGRFLLALENKSGTRTEKFHDIDIVFEIKATSADFDILVDGIGAKWLELNEIDRHNLKPDELKEAIFSQSINQRKHMIAGELKFIK